MSRRFALLALGALVRIITAAPLAAQSQRADSSAALAHIKFPSWPTLPRATAPLASLLVPGTGQLMLHKDRFIAYLALEGLGWLEYAKDSHERKRQEDSFRDLARRVARAHLSPNGPDGDWQYYETMRDFKESGQFSKSDTQLIPETNDSTWNGSRWRLAKGLARDSVAALEIYKQTAYGPDMAWSWQNAGFQYDLFQQATNKRNDANAAMNQALMLIATNHLLSMVDAFATFRLEVRPQGNGRTALGASIPW
jgi:hypothetical protein